MESTYFLLLMFNLKLNIMRCSFYFLLLSTVCLVSCATGKQMVSNVVRNAETGDAVKEKSIYVPKGTVCIIHNSDFKEDSNGEILYSMLLNASDHKKKGSYVISIENGSLSHRLLNELEKYIDEQRNRDCSSIYTRKNTNNKDSLLLAIAEKYQPDMVIMLADMKTVMHVGGKKVTDDGSLNDPITSYSSFEVNNVGQTYTFPKGEQDLFVGTNVVLEWYIYDSSSHKTIRLDQNLDNLCKEYYAQGFAYKEIDDLTTVVLKEVMKEFTKILRMK